jgi:hypothetical protein
MYVSFKLNCEPEKQLKLHKRMRIKIPEWEKQIRDLEPELTYHPTSGFLQAVLSLDIKSSSQERKELSEEEREQIPKQIYDFILSLCRENDITLSIDNHGKEMDCGRKKQGKDYWFGMPNEDIVGVCSVGTRISSEILDKLEKKKEDFSDDSSLRDYIIKRIHEELDADFVPGTDKFCQAFHEVVNPLGIWKNFFIMTPTGFQSEEELIKEPKGSQALSIVKTRSLDCMLGSGSRRPGIVFRSKCLG